MKKTPLSRNGVFSECNMFILLRNSLKALED